jgi:hypothetical protein
VEAFTSIFDVTVHSRAEFLEIEEFNNDFHFFKLNWLNCNFQVSFNKVADHLNTVPNPYLAFRFNADPDRVFHFNVDPDPDPAHHQCGANLLPLV